MRLTRDGRGADDRRPCGVNFDDSVAASEAGVDVCAIGHKLVGGAGHRQLTAVAGGEVEEGQRLAAQFGDDDRALAREHRRGGFLRDPRKHDNRQRHQREDGERGDAVNAVKRQQWRPNRWLAPNSPKGAKEAGHQNY